ncbi:DUF3037 domain-containing protein [Clostridium butyricum]|uniref:DUF3037 domain-containing protein n=1 Tax=Clostridium butyricum TaxID=1492 RepID=UPI002103E372|nr:DUF3037 domain-containing protein [Clostridium butyricum]MCQ2014632.1 DUF3037 domain-containing protein [Clostridium butyricum]MCQ2026601.1 DUF3037 domain-containing protein [Clostridium butyricum]
MEQTKTKVSYSVIRYSPDQLKGEIINVGLLLYNYTNKSAKYFILDEKSIKLRAIMENNIEINIYKSNKELLEFYLEKSKDDLSGTVGDMCITSYYDSEFVDKFYEYYKNKELTFSKPSLAYTKNECKLFETILKRYIGENNVDIEKTTTMTAKKYMKKIFRDNENLYKRIQADKVIKPIKDLDDLEVKIDFSFKNGKWNYMQAIPKPINTNKNTEWFSKIQLLLDSDADSKSKIHLLYKHSDFEEDTAAYNLLLYLKSRYSNVDLHDVDKKNDVITLCSYIEKEGQILTKDAV